jgi:hypothetical protein
MQLKVRGQARDSNLWRVKLTWLSNLKKQMVIAYGVSCFPNGVFFLRAINNQKACFVIVLTLNDARNKAKIYAFLQTD